MDYGKLSNKQLSKYPFPNLMAEIIWSGYSFSTIGDFMGIGAKGSDGKYRNESDPEIWAKLLNREEMLASNALGLAKYYGVKVGYLFSSKLQTLEDKPIAYWRWFDENKKKEEELDKSRTLRMIENELRAKQFLMEFMKVAVTMSDEELQQVIDYKREETEAQKSMEVA
ncbi:MAG: hypothetical protein UFG06_05280 [Lachnospiraceae bacterium]|nr:hypothetical protein [Lachnospiraceae bacterium]